MGPVGIHYRVVMIGPVVVEGIDGGPSPVHGPGCIFIVAPVVIQAHAALQTLQCTLCAPGGVDGDMWVVLRHSAANKSFACSGARTQHPENVTPTRSPLTHRLPKCIMRILNEELVKLLTKYSVVCFITKK